MLFIIIAMISSGYIFYALPFLELYHEYICPDSIPDCNHHDRCLNPEIIKINWDSHKSLENWVERLNLECNNHFNKNDRREPCSNRNDRIVLFRWLDVRQYVHAKVR
jgi:hypothetical protein